MKNNGITPTFHYIPLHSSPAGVKYGRVSGSMKVTDKVSDTLVRLPMYYELNEDDLTRIFEVIERFFEEN